MALVMLKDGGHRVEVLISYTKGDGRDFVRNTACYFFLIRKCNVLSISLKDNSIWEIILL